MPEPSLQQASASPERALHSGSRLSIQTDVIKWVHIELWKKLFGDKENFWDPMSNACLYLLIWGEMGNLRFCPELVAFVFTAARAPLELCCRVNQ